MDKTKRPSLRSAALLVVALAAAFVLLPAVIAPGSPPARAEGPLVRPYTSSEVRPQLVESLRLMGLDRVHRELGITGAGVGVLVMDDWTLNPAQGYVHGQAVAETVQAAAPGATLWLCKLDFAQAGPEDLTACLEEVFRKDLPIRVVNLSFASGDGLFGEPCGFLAQGPDPRSPLAQAIQALSQRGVIFVAASGNDGFKGGLRFPACLPEVVSVGATYDFTGEVVFQSEQVSCADQAVPDKVTCYSDVAPYLDVVAPGTVIRTPSAPNFGGTSAAAPLVSGVIALMLSVQPSLTPPEVVEILRSTGVPAYDPRAGTAFPRVDAYRALQAVLSLPPPPLPPGPTPGLGLEAFDTNGNGLIDDPEFFAAVDAWIAGSLSDGLFFALIDAWVEQVPVRPSSLGAGWSGSSPALGALRADRVWIYDARGRLLAQIAHPTPSRLARRISRWANGVYLYVALWEVEGRWVRTVGKLVLLR